jgi:5-formyltetrahydrofolate cyclo-ligase
MVWAHLEDISVLRITPLGLLEPQADSVRLVEPDGGLCIVPGLGFRRDGHRVGFGGGYYDRFLACFRGDTAALAPEVLFGMKFPIEPHDQAVDVVITELGVHRAER